MKTEHKQVVVVGAGPSGSTVSALLKSRGIDVVVIEKRRSLVSQLAKAYFQLVWRWLNLPE